MAKVRICVIPKNTRVSITLLRTFHALGVSLVRKWRDAGVEPPPTGWPTLRCRCRRREDWQSVRAEEARLIRARRIRLLYLEFTKTRSYYFFNNRL